MALRKAEREPQRGATAGESAVSGQNTGDPAARKRQTCVPHSSGGWFGPERGPTSWVTDSASWLCPHKAEGVQELSEVPFRRAPIPFVRVQEPAKGLPPNTRMSGNGLRHTSSGRRKFPQKSEPLPEGAPS